MLERLARLRHRVTLLAIVLILVVTAWLLTTAPTLAVPIRLHFTGLSSEAEDRIKIAFLGENNQPVQARRHLFTSYWFLWYDQIRWIRRILIEIPADQLADLRELTITIGENEPRVFSGAAVRRWQVVLHGKAVPDGFEVPAGEVGMASSLPWIDKGILNWPGDIVYLRAILQTPLVPCLLLLLLDFWLGRYASRGAGGSPASVTGEPPVPRETTSVLSTRAWNWLGFSFLVVCLVLLEVVEPFYFTQCDTANEELPLILAGCRSYWRGEFPDYNPYTSLGTPLAGTGLAQLTYPPMLLSFAIARHLLFNDNATAEVYAILHLSAGFFLMRRLAGSLGMGALSANLSALSFVLSGAALIMGRSWLNFTAIMFWLPLVFLGLRRIQEPLPQTPWKWVLGMGLAMGLPFHLGFPQIAIYIDGFFCLAVLFLAAVGSVAWRKTLVVLPALLLAAGIAMPLVLQQWLLTQGTERHPAPGQGIAMGLPAMLLPYPLVRADVPARWGNENLELRGQVYFFGGVLALLFLYQSVGLLFFRPGERRLWGGQVWTVCGLVALWLGLGDAGGLWTVLRWLPLGDTIQRHPIRLLPYLAFFACLSGGLALDRLLGEMTRRRRGEMIVAGVALGLLIYHVCQCRTAFHSVNYRPYPPLPADMRELFWKNGQATGRVLAWGRFSFNDSFALQLPKNLPAAYDLPALAGENPLLDSGPVQNAAQNKVLQLPLESLKKYGVRWHLQQHPQDFTPDSPALSFSWQPDVRSRYDEINFKARHEKRPERVAFEQFAPVPNVKEVEVRELDDAEPLAFGKNHPTRSLDLTMHGWGLEVDVSPLGEQQLVVVNFLRWPSMQSFVLGGEVPCMRAYVDGEEVPCLADDDGWNRIMVRVAAGHQTLTVRYGLPWGTGLLFGLATGLAGMLLLWYLARPMRKV
jgi:hypothetical protein